MKKIFLLGIVLFGAKSIQAQTNFQAKDTEFYSPKLRSVETVEHKAPSDAIVLFDGTNLTQWQNQSDPSKPIEWTVDNGILTIKPKSGGIQTKQHFDDFQLHLEWRSPLQIKGEGQGRGNSGIFLQGLYEIQILDNNNNPTYVNGQAASLYKQQPPLVTATKNTGEWHSYDILFSAPKFNKDGILIKKGTVTMLHNGVVVHYNTQIEGTTEYIGMPQIKPHGSGPIALQDHNDAVSFRNIWIRPL